jgi:hypothetical protein
LRRVIKMGLILQIRIPYPNVFTSWHNYFSSKTIMVYPISLLEQGQRMLNSPVTYNCRS